MKTSLFKEFSPALYFLLKFIGLFVVCNLIYGFFVSGYGHAPDPVTGLVTRQTVFFLRIFGWDVSAVNHVSEPTTSINYLGRNVVSIYEGCNGINIAITFLSFLVAFGPYSRRWIWFACAGIMVIHISNLFRIGFLFFVTLKMPDYLYFVHKYLFTAMIYGVVFALWFWWVIMNKNSNVKREVHQ